MQRLITLSKEVISRRFRAIALVCLVGLMSWLTLATQPAFAANSKATVTPPVDQALTEEPRDQAYEEAVEVIDDPNGVQKNYEENLKQYRQENPDQKSLVDDAKDLVNKVTGGK
ncbi:hypothetical protein [Phormidium tenue]|uniref:Low temperature-induced protein n=1 Tax=Phormidium tenue NIES-30 TaxID=549789 RepID=A0A1U7J6J3_9CYAN|nr:hypothetical protein [Phormidium tenue]MBD2233511.1 hypothetical protein [Phormidium tenue FACHB-1052]OKH48621.1 hypothetical protein NIES30_08700 [Phormidium tenue NIES-30]